MNVSLHFIGPPRGVVPIGPNGIHIISTLPLPPLISTLEPSPLSDAETNAAILSYNYTLNHQGLTSNVNCISDTQSPIRFSPVHNNTFLLATNGSCNEIGLADVPNVLNYWTPDTNQTLTFWACKSLPTGEQETAYYIYLRGSGMIYEPVIGNITCTVYSIQPAVFPVTYQSSTRVFSTQEQISTSAPANTFSNFVEYAIFTLGGALREAQTISVNMIAGSVEGLGSQAMGFGLYEKKERYLPLFQAMIQGILVDQV